MWRVLDFFKRVILWILNIRLWQILVFAIVAVVGVLIWISCQPPGSGSTRPESDTPIDRITHFDKPLDAFRAKWDIRGRFEVWPALLPLAEMSNVAYLSESEAKKLFRQFGFDSIVPIESPFHSLFAYVAHEEDVVVVAFRGTDNIEDWFFNVNMYPRRMPEGDLHSGFASAYGTLQSRILWEIEKAAPKHIWITGHSLGGAMALICAYDLTIYHGRNIDGVITFGQPKIGRQNLATSLQKRLGECYVHFVNELDGVPKLPCGFSECGLLLQFLNGKVQKSFSYFRSVAMSGAGGSQQYEHEYVPIDQLPEMSQTEFDELMRQYERKELPVPPRVTSGPMTYGSPLSLKKDHPMKLYVEKIRAAIDKAGKKGEKRGHR